jgi:hypothetical protein
MLRLHIFSLSCVSDTEGGDDDLGTEDSADYDRGWHRAKLADKAHVAAEREEPGVTLDSCTIASPGRGQGQTERRERANTRYPAGPSGSDAVWYADPLRS